MTEKEVSIKKLRKKLDKTNSRSWSLFMLLILQFLIWWILNPDFIPSLYPWVVEIKAFFRNYLWPRTAEELQTGSYRVYIYRLCQWIRALPVYSQLKWAAPRILPAGFLINLLWMGILHLRIRFAYKPKRVKQYKPKPERKKLILQAPTRQKVSGLYDRDKNYRNANLKKLQACCAKLPQAQVIWIGNCAKGANNRAPHDKLYRLTYNKPLHIPLGNDRECRICLSMLPNGSFTAILNTDQGEISLEKGVPYVISYKSESNNEIRSMTVTWIGGAV